MTVSAEEKVRALFWDYRLTPALTFIDRTLVSTRTTHFNGLQWQMRPWLPIAGVGGVGAGRSYFSSSVVMQSDAMTLTAHYLHSSPDFQRIYIPALQQFEPTALNVSFNYRPAQWISIMGNHSTYDQLLPDNRSTRVRIDSVSASTTVRGFNVGAAAFQSRVGSLSQTVESLGVGHRFGDRFDADGTVSQAQSSNGVSFHFLSGSIRERITNHLNLAQYVTRSGGGTSFQFGGGFSANIFQLSVNYQSFYVPVRNGSPFVNAVVFQLSVHLFGTSSINLSTQVDPAGNVRFTTFGNTYLYRYSGLDLVPQGGPPMVIYKNVVMGQVIDEKGNPVRGAAVQIGTQPAFSDFA